ATALARGPRPGTGTTRAASWATGPVRRGRPLVLATARTLRAAAGPCGEGRRGGAQRLDPWVKSLCEDAAMAIDFTFPPEVDEVRFKVRDFMDQVVRPLEQKGDEEGWGRDDWVKAIV